MFVTSLLQGTSHCWSFSSSFDSGIGGKDHLSLISLPGYFFTCLGLMAYCFGEKDTVWEIETGTFTSVISVLYSNFSDGIHLYTMHNVYYDSFM